MTEAEFLHGSLMTQPTVLNPRRPQVLLE